MDLLIKFAWGEADMGKPFSFAVDIIIQYHSISFAISCSPNTPFSIAIARGRQKHLKS